MSDDPTSLDGRTALVTGAAKRIGRQICLALAGGGANVAVHYNRSAIEAQSLVDELLALSVRAEAVPADLSDPKQVNALLRAADDALGPVDILVNNASVFDPQRLDDRSKQHLDLNLQVNADAPIALTRTLARSKREGCVVNMLDATLATDTTDSAYHLSKRKLQDATLTLAAELAPRLRVNGIAPGQILRAPGHDDAQFRKLVDATPLGRAGTPDEIAHAAIFLVEHRFLTGQILYVDGGWHLRGQGQ